MSNDEALEKEAYFKQQELLDLSDDDDTPLSDDLLIVQRAIADSRAMPSPPSFKRQTSSFLGPTPRQKRAEFKAKPPGKHSYARPAQDMARSVTEPEVDVSGTFPSAKSKEKRTPSPEPPRSRKKLKHTRSLPDPVSTAQVQDQTPFYKTTGVMPRELKNGKNIKLADNIKLDPEAKQLLKGKIVYYYPSDDVSMPRRTRLHRIIRLGAAWVTSWRDDIDFIMTDDAIYTYSMLQRHLKMTEFPSIVALVKFDPYIPQCIEFGTLLEPLAGRFLVKGAPRPNSKPVISVEPLVASSQASLQVKPSKPRITAAHNTLVSDSMLVKDSFPPPPPPRTSEKPLSRSNSNEEPAEPAHTFGDALSEAIKQTKALADFLDDDSDLEPQLTSSSEQDSDSCSNVKYPKKPKPKYSKTPNATSTTLKSRNVRGVFNQATFQCMESSTKDSSQNPNARTIEVLQDMGKYYDQMQDQWRTMAYRKAVATLKKQTTLIATADEAFALPFVGKRLADKIEEIVTTNRLRRLDNTRDDATDNILRLFLGVYGAGLVQARTWIQQGYTTLEDLETKARLTDNQKIGIAHYEDFATRIPRAEVKAHGDFVRTALQKIDPGCQAQVMGSYRRGAKDSGDIDVIITKPGACIGTIRNVVFEQLVPKLFAANFLKVKLATSSRTSDGTKWHGASCLPTSKVWRRLDLLIVPEEEMGAALIYFTGNDIFNRSIRFLASKKGMRLNQRGLFKDVVRGKNREKINDGTLLEGRDEKMIFEILGVPWREPNERIC
jgi:DNA polymerase IV